MEIFSSYCWDNRGKYLARAVRITEANIYSYCSDNRGKYLVRTVRITEATIWFVLFGKVRKIFSSYCSDFCYSDNRWKIFSSYYWDNRGKYLARAVRITGANI